MHDIAVTTLALSGKGGGTRLIVFIILLFAVVILAAGWILCAARAREARAEHGLWGWRDEPRNPPRPAQGRGDHPSGPQAGKP